MIRDAKGRFCSAPKLVPVPVPTLPTSVPVTVPTVVPASVFLPCLPHSDAHQQTHAHEGPWRLHQIIEGLSRLGIETRQVIPSEIPVEVMKTISASFHVVHGPLTSFSRVTREPRDTDSFWVQGATDIAVHTAIVTACLAVYETLTTNRATFAAVRPPGHHARRDTSSGYCWRNNSLIASLFATTYLPSSSQRTIFLFDIDFHHGHGIEKIMGELRRYCRQHRIFLLYFSVFRGGSFDSAEESKCQDVAIDPNGGVQIIRRYSSIFSPSWSTEQTAARLSKIEDFIRLHAPSFDLMIVSAGFDHCTGERMEERVIGGSSWVQEDMRLWTPEQVRGLGHTIRQSAERTTTGYVTAILEGGYEEFTMETVVPMFIEAIGIPRMSITDSDLDSDKDIDNG